MDVYSHQIIQKPDSRSGNPLIIFPYLPTLWLWKRWLAIKQGIITTLTELGGPMSELEAFLEYIHWQLHSFIRYLQWVFLSWKQSSVTSEAFSKCHCVWISCRSPLSSIRGRTVIFSVTYLYWRQASIIFHLVQANCKEHTGGGIGSSPWIFHWQCC